MLHYPQVLTACYELKFFAFTQGIQLRCQQALETAKSPQSNLQVFIVCFFLHGEVRSQHIFILFKERQIKINPQHATYENGIISKQKKFQQVK